MQVTLADLVLFAHIALAIVGFTLAAVLHLSLLQLRKGRVVAELRPWAPVIHRVEPLLPVVALLLLGSGAWLIHLSGGEFSWGDGWVIASIVGLVIVEGVGGFLRPRGRALRAHIAEAPDGPVSTTLHHAVLDAQVWYFSHFATAMFFGIVFLMVAKPSAVWSAAVLVLAGALGLITAVPFVSRPHRTWSEVDGRAPAIRNGASVRSG